MSGPLLSTEEALWNKASSVFCRLPYKIQQKGLKRDQNLKPCQVLRRRPTYAMGLIKESWVSLCDQEGFGRVFSRIVELSFLGFRLIVFIINALLEPFTKLSYLCAYKQASMVRIHLRLDRKQMKQILFRLFGFGQN